MNELLEWQKTALALRDQRISSRKICDALGWERSKKSTVNFFFTKHDNDSGFTPKKEITFDGNINNTKIKKFSDYEVELMVRKSIVETKENLKIVVIADTQCKSEEDLTYMGAIGKFIYNEKPDVIVHIGDHYDFPSLSSYDKGKSSSEGRRLSNDIKAGKIEYRLDKTNIIHVPIGKASFTEEQLSDNFQTLMEAIVKARPSTLKGQYLRSVVLTPTMGPGVKVNPVKFA